MSEEPGGAPPLADYPAEVLLNAYVQAREQRLAIGKEAAAKQAEIQEGMDGILAEMQRRMDEQGVDSLRAGALTCYKSTHTSYKVGDWIGFYEWMANTLLAQAHDPALFRTTSMQLNGLFSKEVTRAVGELPALPPGINVLSFIKLAVRNNTAKD